jgi:FAD/FMN-containing dehydrogenase
MSLSRRALLRALSMGTAVVGFDPIRCVWVAKANAHTVPIPALDGRLILDLPGRRAVATDWGKAISRQPLAVLKPGSITDIIQMVRFCRSFHLKMGARGQAHTMYGQSQVGGGVVVDMSSLNRIRYIGPDRASVEAGSTWRELLLATVAQGLTPPVLTDYLQLSVGGTLSVGGVNGTSYRNGAQIDNILDLHVVTGEGDLVSCSAKSDAELFHAVLAGLGQCAIIVRASVRLIRAPANARVFDMVYPNLSLLLADFQTLLSDERFSYLEGLMPALRTGGYTYILEGVSFYDETPPDNAALLSGLNFIPDTAHPVDQTYFQFCDRIASSEQTLQASGRWELPHPWLDIFIPGTQAEAFLSRVLAELSFADVPDFPNLIYGFRRSRLKMPLLRKPDEDILFLFDILRTTGSAQVSAAVEENRRLYKDARSIGGVLYPISAVPLSQHDWQFHFDAEYERLRSAKEKYDRAGILTPGPGIF